MVNAKLRASGGGPTVCIWCISHRASSHLESFSQALITEFKSCVLTSIPRKRISSKSASARADCLPLPHAASAAENSAPSGANFRHLTSSKSCRACSQRLPLKQAIITVAMQARRESNRNPSALLISGTSSPSARAHSVLSAHARMPCSRPLLAEARPVCCMSFRSRAVRSHCLRLWQVELTMSKLAASGASPSSCIWSSSPSA
mmetsp:Transcript_63365/g.185251  ORF Transcript_63365/g.185251 Transcript_63365/m.185251 type:complete len:204 (+) Transcript_63365:1397-2008(+)